MIMVRKGLRKFYDIKLEFIKKETRLLDYSQGTGEKKHHSNLRDFILGPVYD